MLRVGACYYVRHGLLATAKALVALYQVEGDADWSEICAVIAEVLPEVIRKVEATEGGARLHRPRLLLLGLPHLPGPRHMAQLRRVRQGHHDLRDAVMATFAA